MERTAGQEEKAIRIALFDAYPFGERAMHPYKIWLDEIKRQRGLKPDPAGKRLKTTATDPAQATMEELFA